MLGSAIDVYTCLNSHFSEDRKTYLSKFSPHMTRVNLKLAQKQNNVFSCGVFTAVLVTLIIVWHEGECFKTR
jgi:hypothetical protein